MSEEFKNIEFLVEQLKEYANTRLSQFKLSVVEKTSKVISILIAALMSALVFFLFILLASVAAAIAVGQWLNSMWLGFLIMAGLVLLFGMILWMAKDRLLRIPIMNALLKVFFEKEEHEMNDK